MWDCSAMVTAVRTTVRSVDGDLEVDPKPL
jgi:hypothetical protein